MLIAHNLFKKYGNLTVLNDVSLHIKKGEFVSITGPSGAGKSTLLHLLGSLDIPDSGSVRLLDKDVFSLKDKAQSAFRNKNMGFIFQFHHLLPEFSAVENICIPLWIAGESKKNALKIAHATLEIVGLSSRLEHRPSELSGGEQQRVAIARAIVHRPSIVFADEPTGNLDTSNAQSIHELFLKLKKEYNLTFVIVTHNDQLAHMADRMLMMKDGKIEQEVVNTTTSGL